MKIFILILNYRRHKDTLGCIKSLINSDLPKGTKIVVLDNTEKNEGVDIITSKFPKVVLIKNKKNLGFAAGNNIGIKYALKNKATHILIINPDVKVPKKFLPLLSKSFKKDPKIGLIAPALKHSVKGKIYYGLDGYMEWLFAKPKHNAAQKINHKTLILSEFLTFACILITTQVFKKVGLLDERYFMYLEDVDFCLSTKKKGFNLYLDPTIVATHQTSASFSHPRHKLKISFISHLKFIAKWLSFPKNIIAWTYQSLHYPYLYLLWTYHHYKYQS